MLRTFDYIEAYSLTRLRIAALIWMGLVAVGLALICYRLLRAQERRLADQRQHARGRCSSSLPATTVDLGRMAAAWNVRHAREVGRLGCRARPLLPQQSRPVRAAAADRARGPPDPGRAARPRRLAPHPGHGPARRRARPTGTAGRCATPAGSQPPMRASPRFVSPAIAASPASAMAAPSRRHRRPPPLPEAVPSNGSGGAAQAFDSARRAVNEMYAMSHRILIVDDDPHIRQVLSFALGKAGMQTAEAADGESALGAIAAQRPDLVVLDINMPRMSGLDVCRRLRAGRRLPILFLSSRDDEIDRVLGLELGGDDYVVKPFSPREVVARVSAILKRGGRALEEAGATAADQPQPPAARSAILGGALGRATPVAGHRHRVPAAAAARQPALQGLHPRRDHRPAARPRLRHHRPDDRQPYPQPARQIRGGRRRRPDRDPRRRRLPDRRLPGRRRLIAGAQGRPQAPLAVAPAAHHPVRDPAVRRRLARHRRRLPARLREHPGPADRGRADRPGRGADQRLSQLLGRGRRHCRSRPAARAASAPTIDLSAMPVLAEQPAARPRAGPLEPARARGRGARCARSPPTARARPWPRSASSTATAGSSSAATMPA